MEGYREYFVVANYKEDCSLKPGQEVISIDEIQPLETLLFESNVNFFLADPERIFLQKNPVRLIFNDGMPFKCFVQEGNHRLFVSNKLGFKKLVIERTEDCWRDMLSLFLESVVEAFNAGIRKLEQLKVVEDEKLLEIFSMQDDEG